MSDKKLDLYGHFLSVPSCKVGLMLHMAAIPYAYHHVDLMTGAQKAPEYQAINRFTQVPAVVLSGQEICQSDVILNHLAQKFGKLGGADEQEQLNVREWLCWQADRLWNLARARGQIKFQNGAPDVITQLQGASRDALAVLDTYLDGGGFIVGAAPTIADVACFTVIGCAPDAEIDLSPWSNVIAWQTRMLAQEGCAEMDDILPKESSV
jgi:glutathione S-transferase